MLKRARSPADGTGAFLVAALGGLACAATFSVSISQILLGLALAGALVQIVRRRDPAPPWGAPLTM